MFLIFESIGTSELILVGIVALIFLGPRKLPQIARKIGKITAEFRGTANEFKETWRREVDLEEEKHAFDLDSLEDNAVARDADRAARSEALPPPAIKEVDPSDFNSTTSGNADAPSATPEPAKPISEKENWL